MKKHFREMKKHFRLMKWNLEEIKYIEFQGSEIEFSEMN